MAASLLLLNAFAVSPLASSNKNEMPMSILASIPSPSVSAFQLGPVTVHIYALCILSGIVLATFITDARLVRRGAERWVTLDIILWAIPLGIVAARFYHVFTHPGDYFYAGANLWKVFAIWEGGNAIFGALIGGAVGAFIGCRMTGIRFWSFADALAPAMLVAQAAGRLGNYFNQELFGDPTTLPWGLAIDYPNAAWPIGVEVGTLFHPMFLYELVWNLVGVVVIISLEKVLYLRWGKAFGVYLIWYGIGRSFLEAMRLDPSELIFGIRTNIWAAWIAIAVGIVTIIVQSRRHPGRELSVYRPGFPKVKLESTTQ
jgi:prolipoprotein diacylglyceryl transferase